MEGTLYYNTDYIFVVAIVAMVFATDVIDYIIDKWTKK